MVQLWPFDTGIYDAPLGLGGLWKESLTVQTVIFKRCKGFSHHSRVRPFSEHQDAESLIYLYRLSIWREGKKRRRKDGKPYAYDSNLITRPKGRINRRARIRMDEAEYLALWATLKERIRERAPEWHRRIAHIDRPEPHPVFEITAQEGIAR